MNERERIAMLARLFGPGAACGRGIAAGIGDDAALLDVDRGLEGGGTRLAWTIDEQVEGVHFCREFASFFDVGWRSFMAAMSDIAAMGAAPWCALSALVLPNNVSDADLEDLARGQRAAAEATGAALVGGNLSRGPALSISTTILGGCARGVRRSGALVGDGLWLTGRVGLAAAGLRALQTGSARDGSLRDAVAAWRTPRALVSCGLEMASVAHAAIDVSDGLACDVGHLADASGVRAVIDEAALRSDEALMVAARALGVDPIDLALHGGEDYALVVASPAPIVGFRAIGHVSDGRGVALLGPGGELRIEPGGYDHFEWR
ncbi:MAG: thiamine-phosphate kinase [Polyangiaceae bacterium]